MLHALGLLTNYIHKNSNRTSQMPVHKKANEYLGLFPVGCYTPWEQMKMNAAAQQKIDIKSKVMSELTKCKLSLHVESVYTDISVARQASMALYHGVTGQLCKNPRHLNSLSIPGSLQTDSCFFHLPVLPCSDKGFIHFSAYFYVRFSPFVMTLSRSHLP